MHPQINEPTPEPTAESNPGVDPAWVGLETVLPFAAVALGVILVVVSLVRRPDRS